MVYFLCKAYDSDRQNCYFALSLPVRGAWGRSSALGRNMAIVLSSLPVRGAWGRSERTARKNNGRQLSLPVRGAWGRSCMSVCPSASGRCRSPCGERGVAPKQSLAMRLYSPSLPVRGAWGRSPSVEVFGKIADVAPRAGSVGSLLSSRRGKRTLLVCRSPCGERGVAQAN